MKFIISLFLAALVGAGLLYGGQWSERLRAPSVNLDTQVNGNGQIDNTQQPEEPPAAAIPTAEDIAAQVTLTVTDNVMAEVTPRLDEIQAGFNTGLEQIRASVVENATAQAAALEAARQELTGQINEQFAVINGRLDVLEAAPRVDIGPPGDIDLPLLPITPFSEDFSPPPVVEEPEEEVVASAPVPILPPSGTPATSVANVPLPPLAAGPVCQAPALPALAPECPAPALLPELAPEPAPVEEQEANCDCEPVVVVVEVVDVPLPRPRPDYVPPAPRVHVHLVADVQPAPRPAPPPAPPVEVQANGPAVFCADDVCGLYQALQRVDRTTTASVRQTGVSGQVCVFVIQRAASPLVLRDGPNNTGPAITGFGVDQVAWQPVPGGFQRQICFDASLIAGRSVVTLCGAENHSTWRAAEIQQLLTQRVIPASDPACLLSPGWCRAHGYSN